MQRVKAFELRQKDEKSLVEELTKFRKELAQLRVSKVSAAPQVKLARIRVRLRPLTGSVAREKGHR